MKRLSDNQVLQIRHSVETDRALARRLGVSVRTVRRARRGKTFRRVVGAQRPGEKVAFRRLERDKAP